MLIHYDNFINHVQLIFFLFLIIRLINVEREQINAGIARNI